MHSEEEKPKNASEDILKKAVEVIEVEEVIVYPTDTLYGLGANATSERAVDKIFEIKKRERSKPISILVSDFKMLEKYCKVNVYIRKFVKELLPGPYTLIFPTKFDFSFARDTVGVRIPDCAFPIKLVKELGVPITTTSANLSGEKPPTSVGEINAQVLGKVAFVVDLGKCKHACASTVIDLTTKPRILREGIGLGKAKKLLDSSRY